MPWRWRFCKHLRVYIDVGVNLVAWCKASWADGACTWVAPLWTLCWLHPQFMWYAYCTDRGMSRLSGAASFASVECTHVRAWSCWKWVPGECHVSWPQLSTSAQVQQLKQLHPECSSRGTMLLSAISARFACKIICFYRDTCAPQHPEFNAVRLTQKNITGSGPQPQSMTFCQSGQIQTQTSLAGDNPRTFE